MTCENMILGTGVDIEEIKRFKDSWKDKNFLGLIFTDREIEYCNNKKEPYVSFAGKFCVKEAVIKALDKNINIKEIEVINSENGKPEVYISGKKNNKIHCSVSHSKEYAMAFVVLEK